MHLQPPYAPRIEPGSVFVSAPFHNNSRLVLVKHNILLSKVKCITENIKNFPEEAFSMHVPFKMKLVITRIIFMQVPG